jgi:integrase
MASIRKLTNGRWQAQFRPIPGGKQITRTTSRKADAQRWLGEQQALVVTGHFVDPTKGRTSFSAFYQDWAARQIWATSTRITMDNTVKSVTFRDVPLCLLRRSHIELWVKSLDSPRRSGKGRGNLGLAPSTIKTEFTHVRTILRAAMADKRIASDPTQQVKLPRGRRAGVAMTLPTGKEVGALLAAASPEFRLFLTFCAFTGLRRGEAIALKLRDIDFDRRVVTVSRQAQFYSGSRIEVRAPKSGSERRVNLPEELAAMLQAHIAKLELSVESNSWIFPGSGDGPISSIRVATEWAKAKKAAEVSGFRIHDLRHFFASGLIAAGCDVIAVQRALGHANATMTLGTYAHLWPSSEDRTRRAASAMLAEVLHSSDE